MDKASASPSTLPERAVHMGWLALAVAATLLLWQGATVWWGWVSAARFATPAEVWAAFMQVAGQGYGNARWLEHVARSVLLVTMGFVVASSLGVALGLAMGASRRIEAFVNPIFLVLRPIPPLAWIPLAIVWLGLGDAAELVGAVAGLGSILNQASQDIFPAMILVGMISVAWCGWLMTLGLSWIERRAMPWKAHA